jgi:hypothetical protein
VPATRWRAVLGTVSVVLLALAGCGSDRGPTLATAGGSPAVAPDSTFDVRAAYVEAMRGYVACLRAEGVRVSDPDPNGRLQFEGDLKALKADPVWVAAQEKCRALLPPVPDGIQDKPVKTPEEIEVARRYARCMRANGAADFPDPGPDGYLPDRGSEGSPVWNQTGPGVERATRVCAAIIGDPTVAGRGTG